MLNYIGLNPSGVIADKIADKKGKLNSETDTKLTMLEYVFLHYIFTQAGMHVCSVFNKCSMSLLRNNQV